MIARPPASARAAALTCMLASAGALAATVVAAGILTPGYRPMADAVSRLGAPDEPHAFLMRAGFVLYGLLVSVGARALAEHVPGKQQLLSALIGGYGAAAIVAGLAPKDPPMSPHTFASEVHVASTIVGGAMLLTAMAVVARCASLRAERRSASGVLAFTSLGVVVFPFTWGSPFYGLVEILLLTLAETWLVTLAYHLRPRAR